MRPIILVLSWLPFWALHLLSTGIYFLVYRGLGYRRKVVRENLRKSFPNESEEWLVEVERKFYRNFCDVIVESIKTTTITTAELQSRVNFKSREQLDEWFKEGVNINGISSHLANWEWLPLSLGSTAQQGCFAVYKPLSNLKMNTFMRNSRERFGLKMIPIKELRAFFENPPKKPYILGLLSDQAPHDYSKAFEVEFLNQKTYYVPGPGVLCVKHNLLPTWAGLKRVGRSRYEWGLEKITPDFTYVLNDAERAQVERMAKAHDLSAEQSDRAYRIVKEYSRLLELQVRKAPEDWLWTHRRWKSR